MISSCANLSSKLFYQIAPPKMPPITLPPRANPTVCKEVPKLFNNIPHTYCEVHCPHLLLHLTLTPEHDVVVQRQILKGSPPLTTATYTNHHQNQQHRPIQKKTRISKKQCQVGIRYLTHNPK